MDEILRDVLERVQSSLEALRESVSNLTTSVAVQKQELLSLQQKTNADLEQLHNVIEELKHTKEFEQRRTSDRVFEIVKLLAPWIVAGLITYFNVVWKR